MLHGLRVFDVLGRRNQKGMMLVPFFRHTFCSERGWLFRAVPPLVRSRQHCGVSLQSGRGRRQSPLRLHSGIDLFRLLRSRVQPVFRLQHLQFPEQRPHTITLLMDVGERGGIHRFEGLSELAEVSFEQPGDGEEAFPEFL